MTTDLLEIFVEGKLVNPKNVTGLGLWKHRRLIRRARERAQQAILVASCALPGRAWPWAADVPKRILFTSQVPSAKSLLDDDSLPYAISPIRDALGDCGVIGKTSGTVKGPGRVKDGPMDGHVFTYQQVVTRHPRGVLIQVERLR